MRKLLTTIVLYVALIGPASAHEVPALTLKVKEAFEPYKTCVLEYVERKASSGSSAEVIYLAAQSHCRNKLILAKIEAMRIDVKHETCLGSGDHPLCDPVQYSNQIEHLELLLEQDAYAKILSAR